MSLVLFKQHHGYLTHRVVQRDDARKAINTVPGSRVSAENATFGISIKGLVSMPFRLLGPRISGQDRNVEEGLINLLTKIPSKKCILLYILIQKNKYRCQ